MNNREAELQRCLEKTLKFLKIKRPYVSDIEALTGCDCQFCVEHRELNREIRRITRTLRKDGKP